MIRTLCRIALTALSAAAVLLAIGVFPHPTGPEARTMMYVASAIAIVALGRAWRPGRSKQA